MKAIKCILPTIMFLFVGMIGQAQVATKTAEVNTKVKDATCQKVCKPAACEAMVKLGLCTPEQAAKCQKAGTNVKMASTDKSAKCQNASTNVKMASTDNVAAPKATKVAAVSKERAETKVATPAVKAKSCAKTCGSAKKEN